MGAWSEPGRTTLELKTGGWRTSRPVYVEATPPCRAACPAGEPVSLWIEQARAGNLARAWALIREENPFPAVTGRVCAHPCEAACNRGRLDGAVAINALEQFVGDWGLRHGVPVPTAVSRRERIAIVGGGPAGLACAYHLARLGHAATIFEADARLGGVLRQGIPEYRLPRAVLDHEIDLALSPAIEVRTGRRLGRDLTWQTLRDFDAVFLATGAGLAGRLPVPGADARRVGSGLAFLRDVNAGAEPAIGPRVVVIGGGSTAMDVARTARRLGACAVTVLALEAREAMPAGRDEVAQALAEGVEIRNGVGVRAFRASAGTLTAVVVAPARLDRAADGTIEPIFAAEGADVSIEADTALLAVGQEADLDPMPSAVETERGIVVAGGGGQTSMDGVFAGGDLTSRRRTVVEAIGAGTRAARAIHAQLSARSPGPFSAPRAWAAPRPEHVVAFDEIAAHAFARTRPAARGERLPERRLLSFAEVVTGLGERAALREAARCFTCGRCVACDVCLAVCPDMAIARQDGGYRVSADHCKGCGLCVRECPRGALTMVAER